MVKMYVADEVQHRAGIYHVSGNLCARKHARPARVCLHEAAFRAALTRKECRTSFGKASVTVALLTGIPLCLDSNNDIPTGDKVQQYLKNYFVSMLIVAIAYAHSTPLGIQKSASYMPSVEDKDPAATDSSMSDRSSLASPPRDYPDHDSLDFKHMPGPASYRSNSSNGTVISDISLSSGEHLVPSTLVLKITAQYVMVQTTPNRERSDSTMTAGEPDTE